MAFNSVGQPGAGWQSKKLADAKEGRQAESVAAHPLRRCPARLSRSRVIRQHPRPLTPQTAMSVRIPNRPGLATGCLLTGLSIVMACSPAPAPIDVVEVTIDQVQTAIRDGATTCRMVTQAHLDRIDRFESGLNAITVINPRALDVADSIDRALAAGAEPGSLFCVPMLVKDNFDTHDMVTSGGSIALIESIPPDDAFMVRRIREEGAVIVAKTNMAEWAFSPRESVSSSFGTTRNAYALDRVPAGSSGGTASGVAAGFGLIGLGSDTGNSIRGPSSHLALVGIRSTIGLTSRDGVIPLSFDRDIAGPMGRSVEDVARVFNVVAGYDPADPYTESGRDHKEADYTSFLRADGLEGTRVGVLRSMVDPEQTHPEVLALFEAAIADLVRLGAEVIDVDLDIAQESRRPNIFCRRFRYDMSVYLSSLGSAAPIRDVAEVIESGQFHPSAGGGLRSFARLPADVHPSEWETPCPDFATNPSRQEFLASVVSAMDDAGVGALIYPSWLWPPAHLDQANEEYRGDNSQRVAPATGMPAITVPMGYTSDGGDDAVLPAGLQILGRPWDEGLLFQMAYAYEQGTGHRRAPAGFPEIETPGR